MLPGTEDPNTYKLAFILFVKGKIIMNYGRVIGVGRTATVYEYTDNKVLKLFNKGYPKKAVEKEFNNALAINNLNFSKPKAYEVVDCRGQKACPNYGRGWIYPTC